MKDSAPLQVMGQVVSTTTVPLAENSSRQQWRNGSIDQDPLSQWIYTSQLPRRHNQLTLVCHYNIAGLFSSSRCMYKEKKGFNH